MKKVIDNLGWIVGAMSLVLLAKEGFQFGLAAPFEHALGYYQKLLRVLFGWAAPFISTLMQKCGLHLNLYSHWKNVFVLMWLYFGVLAKVIWGPFKSVRGRGLLISADYLGSAHCIRSEFGGRRGSTRH